MKSRTIATLILCALATSLAPDRTDAQVVKPFKVNGGGFAPGGISLIPGVPAFHDATGNATELGAYEGEGWFSLLGFTGPLTAVFSSAPDFVFTAANGDDLAFTYGAGALGPGVVTLYPGDDGTFVAVFVAEFNPVPAKCTGRFAKVIGGTFIMIAISEPFSLLETQTTPFDYSWQGNGTLTFRTGR